MELKIIEEKKNRLVFDLQGETHTIVGILKKELYNDDHVKAAGYNVSHPLINIPRFVIETDGEDPKKVVKSTIKRLQKQIEKLKEEVKEVK